MNVIFGIIRLTYLFTLSARYKQWLEASPHTSPGFLYFILPYFRKGEGGDGKEEDGERFRSNLHFTEICNLNQDDVMAVIREAELCVHIYGGVNFNVVL
jgi:hypothetical protein